MSKIMAWVVIAALMVSLTACSRKKPEEDTRPAGSYGYKKYQYYEGREKEKKLLEEYENLVTETMRNVYDESGALKRTCRTYFDETGEHLLKDVRREVGGTTETKEYDQQGRCIAETSCFDEETRSGGTKLDLQVSTYYLWYSSKRLFGIPLNAAYGYGGQPVAESNVKEIRTTYSYRGDTAEITGVRTIADQDSPAGLLELGDGDIVLTESLHTKDLQYEESYDPSENKGTFGGNTDEAVFRGIKEYDTAGRIVRIEYNSLLLWEENLQNSEYNYRCEREFFYRNDGYWEEETHYFLNVEGEFEKYLLERSAYDGEGRLLSQEKYTDLESETPWLESQSLYEYTDDGKPVKMTNRYNWEESYYEVNIEYTYTENGCIVRFFDRTNDEESVITDIPEENSFEYYEDPAIQGRLIHITVTREDRFLEAYAIAVPNEYDLPEDDWGDIATYTDSWYMWNILERRLWVMYYCTVSDGGLSVKTVSPEFDDDGRLREVVWKSDYEDLSANDNGSVFHDEYDEQGRLCRSREKMKSMDSEIVTEWEYWDRRGE